MALISGLNIGILTCTYKLNEAILIRLFGAVLKFAIGQEYLIHIILPQYQNIFFLSMLFSL